MSVIGEVPNLPLHELKAFAKAAPPEFIERATILGVVKNAFGGPKLAFWEPSQGEFICVRTGAVVRT